ncbi:MAG: ATP-binding protein [Acidobacteriota bacterium]
MSALLTDTFFPRGLLRPELLVGVTVSVTASTIGFNLSEAGRPVASHFMGGRYGCGEVGEFVLIEGQQCLLLGRISEIGLREPERRSIRRDLAGSRAIEAYGFIRPLGTVAMDCLRVTAGVNAYPRLGDRVYAAPHDFVALLPRLMEQNGDSDQLVTINLGAVDEGLGNSVAIQPERLFGRHCAILGATGGGKSWTAARILEESIRFASKVILIDATGEYRGFSGDDILHFHLGDPVYTAEDSVASALPPTSFQESDFVALFQPAGKIQGPKLRAAIRSLRLARLRPDLAPSGFIEKIDKPKARIEDAEREPGVSSRLDDPRQPFDVRMLVKQIEQECVYPEGFADRAPRGTKDPSKWGGEDGNFAHCLPLVARINGLLISPAFSSVFGATELPGITSSVDSFIASRHRLMRICLSGVPFEFSAREVIANTVGRHLLTQARGGAFRSRPALVVVDEAHNFLGQDVGGDGHASSLNAYELAAREGRKYGLNICLISQRPRDLTEGVLSQMGTLIVHRLTNENDRGIVERACGEIDRAASKYLPNLRPGEAAIIGTDFPIPLTIRVFEPRTKPTSSGPDYQKHWAVDA